MLRVARQLLLQNFSVIKTSSKEYSDSKKPKSAFADVKTEPPVEVFELLKLYNADSDENKVNLGMGAYRTNEGKPFLLPIVQKCEQEVVCDPKLHHEYLPILGNAEFSNLAMEMLLGKDCKAVQEKRVLAVHTLSGTGALRLGAEFIAQQLKKKTVYFSMPTWNNHIKVFKAGGFKKIKSYAYWNSKKHSINMSKLLADLAEAPEGAVVVFHGAAHNPTGTDPTEKQWKQIAGIMKARNLFPFFDTAYQGFASGDADKDAWAVRYFVEQGFELLAAQSFAKNMGLYGERVGNLVVVLNDKSKMAAVESQLAILVRINYSNPPAHGSRIVARVLGDEDNRAEWNETIKCMALRIKEMRKALKEALLKQKTPGNWDHIESQIGMFLYIGLNPQQVEKLKKQKHIYLPLDGRINVCGLTTKNVEYVAKSISEVVKGEDEDGDDEGDDCGTRDEV